jgi:hypothetical protein
MGRLTHWRTSYSLRQMQPASRQVSNPSPIYAVVSLVIPSVLHTWMYRRRLFRRV